MTPARALLSAVAFIWLSVTWADNGSREEIQGDLILMQGKWKLVDFVYYHNGVTNRLSAAQRNGLRMVSGNKYHLKLRIGPQSVDGNYSFRLYPHKTPKAFDVTLPDGRQIKGIYEINADTLHRSYSQPNQPRPVQFKTGNQTYQVWKRVVDPPKDPHESRRPDPSDPSRYLANCLRIAATN